MIPRIRKVWSIQGNDVESLMKYLQVDPSFGKGILKYNFELKNKIMASGRLRTALH